MWCWRNTPLSNSQLNVNIDAATFHAYLGGYSLPPRPRKNMKQRKFIKPVLPVNYVIRYESSDGSEHKITNTSLAEIKKTERYLRDKGIKNIDIAVTISRKSEGSEMFPVNN